MVRGPQAAHESRRTRHARRRLATSDPHTRRPHARPHGALTVMATTVSSVRKSDEQIAVMRRAGKVVAEMHDSIRAAIRPGVTTAELDAIARDVIDRRGATSNFLNYGYPPFPAVVCTSPNDVIVHGIPGDYRLRDGDIISIDCGAIVDGWHGDAA